MARTDEELTTALRSLESDLVERKESLRGQDGTERICQAICAFSNDLPDHRQSGVIFVGATDDGRPSGIDVTDQLLLTLAGLRDQGRILPPPMVTIRSLPVDEHHVAVIEVEPSLSPPVRFNGQIWIRVGPRRAIATADEERRLAERRRGADLQFDAREVRGSNLDDLDMELFEREYLPSLIDAETLAANGRTPVQRLSSLRLTTTDGIPTNAGILILGAEPTHHLPGAYLHFLRVDGVDLSDNPVLAEAMAGLGYVQRFGAGLPISRRTLADNGNPAPEFTADPSYVGVIVSTSGGGRTT